MNLKPKLLKIIICLIIMIIATVLTSYLISKYGCSTLHYMNREGVIPKGFGCRVFSSELLIPSFIVIGIPTLIITYLIYSLFQKKYKTKKR